MNLIWVYKNPVEQIANEQLRQDNHFPPVDTILLGVHSKENQAFSQNPKVHVFFIAFTILGTGNSRNQNKLEVTQIDSRSLSMSSVKDLEASLQNKRLS